MKTINKIKNCLLVALAVVGTSMALQSCEDDAPEYPYSSELHSFGPSPASRGETIKFIGEGLGKVNKIIFPVGVEVTDFVSKSDTEIVCPVPQEAVPGKIRLVMGGREIETRSIITFSEPITVETVTAEKEELTAGDEIVVTGEYLYNIATVTFGNNAEVTTEDFTVQERHELRLKVPAAAKTGKITFSDGADWSYTTEQEFVVRTAEVTSLSKTELQEGEEVTLFGENLQLVKAVYFPGEIAVENYTIALDGKSLVTTVPVGTCSGVITLELHSLDRISSPEFTVPTIEIASVTPNRNLVGGQQITVKGSLLNLVSGIEFPGCAVIYEGWSVNADGTELTATVPAAMVDGKINFIQNSNIIVASEAVTMQKNGNEFWKGNFALGGWENNLEVAAEIDADMYAAFSEAITAPGKLTIHFEQDASQGWWQLQPRYRRDWNIVFTGVRDNGNSGIIETEAGQSTITLNISQEDIDELNGAGWAFSGCNMTITSMEYEDPNAAKIFLTCDYDISPDGDWANLELSITHDEENGRTYWQMMAENINAPGTLVMNIEPYEVVPDEEEIQVEFRYLYNGWKEHFTNAPSILTIEPGQKSVTIQLSSDDVDALHGRGKYESVTKKNGNVVPCEPWEKGWAISGKYFVIKSFAFKAD
ncbi:MAG: hypothetical protein K2G24_10950 [Muribaculaceae bacterium]|nr:hypothetical protein [Muribaculaceae bacterium]